MVTFKMGSKRLTRNQWCHRQWQCKDVPSIVTLIAYINIWWHFPPVWAKANFPRFFLFLILPSKINLFPRKVFVYSFKFKSIKTMCTKQKHMAKNFPTLERVAINKWFGNWVFHVETSMGNDIRILWSLVESKKTFV